MPENKKPSFTQEFRTFISRGNVIDLAVGIIIGSAFTGIVNSLVKEVIMPPIGILVGRVNFNDLKIILQPERASLSGQITNPEVAIMYGSFIQSLLNFLIVALVVFSLVKGINALKKKEQQAEDSKKDKEKETELSVLKDIRASLKKK